MHFVRVRACACASNVKSYYTATEFQHKIRKRNESVESAAAAAAVAAATALKDH